MENWYKVLNSDMEFAVMTNVYPTKGNLVYEYNPLRNYRLSENKYWYNEDYYTLEELKDKYNITITPGSNNKNWSGVPAGRDAPILYQKGQLVDFNTDELKFSIDHPVHITPQYSYDGSVNLILNDGISIPRLINTRFSATGKNTYEVVDRKGSNDTNIYDQGEQFDIDTSLYKRVTKIPKITFLDVAAGGNLKVGNYHFYFKFSDADGNETDFVGESGLVSIFIGYNNPRSVHTGQKNENSHKSVKFILSNIDTSYDYVNVYYSRDLAEGAENASTEYVKIDKKFTVNAAAEASIVVTGFEQSVDISYQDINLMYMTADAVTTSTVCQNMLFLGNVHKPDIPYNELQDLSLRFLPYFKEEPYMLDMDERYYINSSSKGYYDPKFIYNKTGYWNNEFYRFGIVYIMPNNELTPVFNIRGRYKVKPFNTISNEFSENKHNDGQYNEYYVYKKDTDGNKTNDRVTIKIKEESNYVINPENGEGIVADKTLKDFYENAKGVVSLDASKDTNTIYSLDIRTDEETIEELKKYVKGYFFVRQKRIPTILAQGITVGIDKNSHTPTIPTAKGFLTDLQDSLKTTYVETRDINDVNYISEGFLSRYNYKVVAKKSSIWKRIGLSILKAAAIGITAVGVGVFFPPAGALMGSLMGTIGLDIGFYAAAALTATAFGAVSGVVTGIGMTASAGISELVNVIKRTTKSVKLEGKHTKIPSGYQRKETDSSRQISEDFLDRVIIKDSSSNEIQAIICPDYEINQTTYNQLFTGNEHVVRTTISQNINALAQYSSSFFENDNNHFYVPSYYDDKKIVQYTCKIIAVPDNTKLVGMEDLKFRSRAGEAEEAWRYESISEDYKSTHSKNTNEEDKETQDNKQINSDIIRGSFGPYLGMSDFPNLPCATIDILIPGYSESNAKEYINIRMNDHSEFFAISDRYSIQDSDNHLIVPLSNIIQTADRKCGYYWNLYRGDCYICQFSHRINRNFNDPSAPYNDQIVDKNTWKDNYDLNKLEKQENINLGDVNAVQLGMWVTFRIRSSNNLNVRTLDGSNVDETTMTGHPHGYYPYFDMITEGAYKHADSGVYNKGFATTLSRRSNFELPDVPHIKNWFGTRIMYSDIHINDAFKNGFRVFRGDHYRDYTREYGEIVKLITLDSNILCVFEHGVALIPVNERAVAGEGVGGNIYINTSNVLPEAPKIISDMFGSQWADSVLKVPGKTGNNIQYVYGVDTVAKKIWRTDGNTLECISDFRVQEFLNNNITLGERELTPKIGIRNVKTMYNAFKRDVLFTFYDDTYGFEEKVWNLCWNELLQKFITFYSWVPSFMENINNIPFSFNRDVSKWVAKLGTSHTENSLADGITLSNVLIEDTLRDNNGPAVSNMDFPVRYLTKQGTYKTIYCTATGVNKYIGVLSLSNRLLPEGEIQYNVHYTLERDNYGNRDSFEIVPINCQYNGYTFTAEEGFPLPEDAMYAGQKLHFEALCFKSGSNDEYHPIYYKDNDEKFQEVKDEIGNIVCIYRPLYTPESLYSELYYRNSAGHIYADLDAHKLGTDKLDITYIPMNLNETFKATDVKWIADTLNIPIENAQEYVGQSKCWVKDEPTLRLFEALYPPQTIIGFNSPEYSGDNPPETAYPCTNIGEIRSITANIEQDQGAAIIHGIRLDQHWVIEQAVESKERKVWYELPIFKDVTGKRPMLPLQEQVNPNKLVTLLNIKAHISIIDEHTTSDLATFKNMSATYTKGSSLIDVGYYESTVAVAPKWNMQFLTSDFWKHGQAGTIDIADEIFPTYWYGRQHPFEFECVVVNDPSVHKIFTNLELVANKAKPESFHYEVIGETYDFAKDKPNMYFRQEAMKALWQYNGADIAYNRNFLKVIPKQNNKSADLIHRYYTRQDTINNIEDYYIKVTTPDGHDYNHLSGAEIVYYPTRQEFRIWNHAQAVDMDDLPQDDSRSIIAANCKYLEDRWKVTINPILVCYKNEFVKGLSNTTWSLAKNSSMRLPSLPIYNSPIPDQVLQAGMIKFPEGDYGMDNALYDLYDLSKYGVDNWKPLDLSNWLNGTDENGEPINKYNYFGEASNRKEIDLKDKFMKVRIRYSGEELAIIDFLNTLYRISYA